MTMRRVRILGAALAAAAAVAAAAVPAAARLDSGRRAASAESAGVFAVRIVDEELHGMWARQWSELHPGHRALITRGQYVACSRGLGTNIGDEVLTVRSVAVASIHVRDVPQRTSALVTLTMRRPGSSDSATLHVHAVSVAGHWTWILGERFLDALAQGRCLDGTPLAKPAGPPL